MYRIGCLSQNCHYIVDGVFCCSFRQLNWFDASFVNIMILIHAILMLLIIAIYIRYANELRM